MKKFLLYTLFTFLILTSNAQYYLRGEVRDDKNVLLQNVKIFLFSNHLLCYSGNEGTFGISTPLLYDSMSLSLDGYETKTIWINANQFQSIVLKSTSSNVSDNSKKLVSITTNKDQSSMFHLYGGNESYFSIVENEIVDAKLYPNTSFALNIDKASYSNVRRFLNMGSIVPPDAVRIDELLNYFDLHYREPDSNNVFEIGSQVTDCPWNGKNKLLYLNISARKINLDKVPPSNLVFLIDASGSMDMPNKLPLLKAAFQMLVKNLRPTDTVSIVAFGGNVSLWLKPTSGMEKDKIIQSIEEIASDGDTPGEEAIKLAYKTAEKAFIKNGNNRVILATDGDFNVGETREDALEDLITKERQTGIYLTCLGVGTGNFKDSKLQALAKKGNGNYSYLDDIREAEKVLVKEMTQNFFAIANNVSLNVQFNSDMVQQYRLIGFDNRKEAVADSIQELEGGEIGSGNNLMAIFEVTPTSSNKFISGKSVENELARLSLNYDLPDNKETKEIRYSCRDNYLNFATVDKDLQFAAALAMFGMKLRESPFLGNMSWKNIESIAQASYDSSNYLQKEFLQLLENAKKIYGDKKKKKSDD